jgi:uncharacterized protein YndB with AHSA1/START domain
MGASDRLWLRMTCVLPAPRMSVWQSMTDPEQLAGWWGPKGFSSPAVDFAPRVGQRYRITMQPPEGELFHLDGEFREVDPPTHLAYTFRWDPPDPEDRETLVTLSLRDAGDRTEVELTQGEFATPARLELHRGGWTDSFERLEESLG